MDTLRDLPANAGEVALDLLVVGEELEVVDDFSCQFDAVFLALELDVLHGDLQLGHAVGVLAHLLRILNPASFIGIHRLDRRVIRAVSQLKLALQCHVVHKFEFTSEFRGYLQRYALFPYLQTHEVKIFIWFILYIELKGERHIGVLRQRVGNLDLRVLLDHRLLHDSPLCMRQHVLQLQNDVRETAYDGKHGEQTSGNGVELGVAVEVESHLLAVHVLVPDG